jgi:hypothetical protein
MAYIIMMWNGIHGMGCISLLVCHMVCEIWHGIILYDMTYIMIWYVIYAMGCISLLVCQIVCEIWHGIIWHESLFVLTWETCHGI